MLRVHPSDNVAAAPSELEPGACVGDRVVRDPITRGHNIALLEAPGNDAVSSTTLAGAGAALVLLTTGRGTSLGFPVPTVEIASNHRLAKAKPHWIDFEAEIALGQRAAAAETALLDCVIATASGRQNAAERAGQRAIAI